MKTPTIYLAIFCVTTNVASASDWTLYDYSYGTDTHVEKPDVVFGFFDFRFGEIPTYYNSKGIPRYVDNDLEQHVDEIINRGEFGWLPNPPYSSPLDEGPVDQTVTAQLDLWGYLQDQGGGYILEIDGFSQVEIFHNWNRNEGEYQHWKGSTFTAAEDKREVIRWEEEPGWITHELWVTP
jgi:hypothetical protein